MVPEEISIIPTMHHGFDEHPNYRPVSKLPKPSIRREHPTAHNPESQPGHTLREEIVLREQRSLVEAAQRPERILLEQHEHPRSERLRE